MHIAQQACNWVKQFKLSRRAKLLATYYSAPECMAANDYAWFFMNAKVEDRTMAPFAPQNTRIPRALCIPGYLQSISIFGQAS